VRSVVFDVVPHAGPPISWSIHRDGQPCELELMDDAVLVHQQWELNRLAIETQPASIHAAAVALDGRAALLIGNSHSGKTTLAGWLATRLGAGYLTDEVAAIEPGGQVVPFTRPLGVRSDSPLATAPWDQHLRGEGGADTAARFMRDERLLPVSELGGRPCHDPTPVALLVFPTYDPFSTLDVRPVDQADAFERVAALTPGLAEHGRPVFERLCRVVEVADAFEVRYDDVSEAAPVVLAALEQGVDG
jgi:hypothetical protein